MRHASFLPAATVLGERRLTRFVLASGSPQRRELLIAARYRFETVPGDIDETPLAGEAALDYAARIARLKSQSYAAEDAVALGADTIVVHDGVLMGKPVDAGEAVAMLQRLAGSTHQVMTGWALTRNGAILMEGIEVTQVRFRRLTAAEIATYVAGGEPMDRAGAYAIQGGAGAFIERIEGSYSNVAGLPMEVVTAALGKVGIQPLES
jgi:septum formation protein